jgi:hypothetical protein
VLGAQQRGRVEGAARDLVPVPGFEGRRCVAACIRLRHAAAKPAHSRGSSCSGTIDHAREGTRYDSHGSGPSNHESDGGEVEMMRENDTAALQSRMPGQRRTPITRPEYGRWFAGFMGSWAWYRRHDDRSFHC